MTAHWNLFKTDLYIYGTVGYWIRLHWITDEQSCDVTVIPAEETVNHCHDEDSPSVVKHHQLSRDSLVAIASQSTPATGGEKIDSNAKHMSIVHKPLEAEPTGYC